MIIFFIFLTINYYKGILKLIKIINYYKFNDYKIIINSKLKLPEFKFEFKFININDELDALNFAIHYFDINDNDFIIKINGNCTLKSNSLFIKAVYDNNNNNSNNGYDIISKYFFSDLIGIRCGLIKMIDKNKDIHIQLRYEKLKSLVNDNKLLYLDYLGIDISQTRNNIYTIY